MEGTSAHTEAFLFLARHNLEHNNAYDTAAYYAQKCCEYPEVSHMDRIEIEARHVVELESSKKARLNSN